MHEHNIKQQKPTPRRLIALDDSKILYVQALLTDADADADAE